MDISKGSKKPYFVEMEEIIHQTIDYTYPTQTLYRFVLFLFDAASPLTRLFLYTHPDLPTTSPSTSP